MKKLLPILLILFSCNAWGQVLLVDSTRFITGTQPGAGTGIEYAIPTEDKGIFFAGYDVGNPRGIIPSFLLDTVEGNVFVGKIDSNQKISWLKVYGGSMADGATDACQTPDGGYAVVATTASSNGDVTGFLGGNDIWVLRLDTGGNLLWEKCYGSTQSDQGMAIANTPDGGFIILGTSNGSNHDVPFHYGSMLSLDWVVIKTDSAGNVQWSNDIGGTGDEQMQGAIIAANGGYYIVSSTNSTDYNCTDTCWHPGVNTGYDYYLIKLDTAGNVLWDSSYGGSGTDILNTAMFDVRDSTIIICGNTGSDDYMATGGDGGMWVLKINKDGKLIWQKTLANVGANNSGSSLCIAPVSGYMAFGTTSAGGIGSANAWIVNVDSNGNEMTAKIFGGTGGQGAVSIVPYLNGYAATGNSSSIVFTEGTTYGNFENGGMFISYIGYWPLLVNTTSAENDQLQVYPNPSLDKTRVVNAGKLGNITIVNYLGQVIYTTTIQSQEYINISTAGWMKGLYLIQWHGEDGSTQTAKMIKE